MASLFHVILSIASVQGTSAQLDSVIASWTLRHGELSSVEYVLEGEVVTTPDFLTGLGSPTKALPDSPQPIHIHAKLDLPNQRLWMRRDEFRWQAVRGRFERRITEIIVSRGKSAVVRTSHDTQRRTIKTYDKVDPTLGLSRSDTAPIWLNSGMLALGDSGASLFSLPDYAKARQRWTLIPDDLEKSKGIVQFEVHPTVSGGATYLMTVDAHKDDVVTRLEERDVKGRVTLAIDIGYSESAGGPVVSKWQTTAYGGAGNLLIHEALRVTRFAKDCNFPDEDFAFPSADDVD